MSAFDLIIRHGTVVTSTGLQTLDVGLNSGKIAALDPELAGDGREVIDARGLHVFPGLIDAHVHFNEPGREHWEGLETGSRALAAGGGTMFFDMPLNAHPPTIDAESFRLKLAAAQQRSLVDFAFWGGLVPGNLERLAELAACGVIGFKAFMANSGIEDFPCVERHTLREGMERAARLRLPVAVHAESEAMTRELAQGFLNRGRTAIRDYLESRPIAAELDAIRSAVDLAGETGCALHVVHVSCGSGVALLAEARRRGVDVSCETCPHYLLLTDEDMVNIGATAKCAPPLRSAADQAELWRRLLAGEIHTLGSDHSPSPPEMKRDTNFFKVWGGISSVQHTLPLLLTEMLGRGLGGVLRLARDLADGLCMVASLLSERVASRFKLPSSKGLLCVGADADLALVDVGQSFEVRAEDLLYRHAQTPYLGRTLRGRVVRTLLRGHTVFKDGQIVSKPLGRLVKPLR
jgi:allantoinase